MRLELPDGYRIRSYRAGDKPALLAYADNRNVSRNLRDRFPYPYTPEVADGVISALRSSGALLPTLYAMAGAWEVGGDAGLAALAKAVEAELAASARLATTGRLHLLQRYPRSAGTNSCTLRSHFLSSP